LSTTVEASATTAAELRRRGGDLYLWLNKTGMLRVKTKPPRTPITFETIEGDGFTVHVDAQIKPPKMWRIIHKRLPWSRFDALYGPPTDLPVADGVIEGILRAFFTRP
jgi:hypothetical protein